tara:strand:- start:109 stop:312 length:204 start_codon:yes stop_codon:yes gene_type:complete
MQLSAVNLRFGALRIMSYFDGLGYVFDWAKINPGWAMLLLLLLLLSSFPAVICRVSQKPHMYTYPQS